MRGSGSAGKAPRKDTMMNETTRLILQKVRRENQQRLNYHSEKIADLRNLLAEPENEAKECRKVIDSIDEVLGEGVSEAAA